MKLMVIDGNSLLNRAFYGTPVLTNVHGQATNAVYGFLTMLNKLEREENPQGIVVTFDEKAPTFRHLASPQYKANRKKAPTEFTSQIPLIRQVLTALNIPHISMAGWEADDLMGTLAEKHSKTGGETLIVTGDKDALQLVTPLTTVRLIITGKPDQSITPQLFQEKYGFPAIHIIDLKSFMGDGSDNISGVKGVGKVTAENLIQKYHSIDNIYEKLQDPDESLGLTPRMRNIILSGEEDARSSYDLATIRLDVPVDLDLQEISKKEADTTALLEILQELQLNKLISLYGLGELQEEQQFSQLSAIEREEVTTLSRFRELLTLWEKEDISLSVLPLPGLGGIALGQWKENGGICTLFLEHSMESYHIFLQELFTAPVKLLAIESKSLSLALLQEGITPTNITFDVEVAAYLLAPDSRDYFLENLSLKYAQIQLKPKEEYLGAEIFSPLSNPENAISTWSSHAVVLANLAEILEKDLEKEGLLPLFREVELPLCQVLAEMEQEGIPLDRSALLAYEEKVAKLTLAVQEKIYEEAGEEFNLQSPKQLGVILFEKLDFPPVKKTKTGYSTNVDVLEKLQSDFPDKPIIHLIMEHRHLSKLHATYAKGLLKELSPQNKIHSRFQNTVTATGRLSSVEPNLQNIPIRTELGAELRNMFVATEENVLIDADYSQIELRLLAHIAQDETMLEAFRSGEDIHSQTASQVFHVPLEAVTATMRRSAKAVNFGIVYGMSAFALSQDIGVTVAEAQNYIKRYFDTYPKVKEYLDNVILEATESGAVTTLLGRKRWLPELKSSNFQRRSFAQRMAQNTPIQGAAADVIKKAMLAVSNRLKAENRQGKLILQVHDELIILCPKSESEAVAKLVQEEMEGVLNLSLPLLAETHIGKNWGEAH